MLQACCGPVAVWGAPVAVWRPSARPDRRYAMCPYRCAGRWDGGWNQCGVDPSVSVSGRYSTTRRVDAMSMRRSLRRVEVGAMATVSTPRARAWMMVVVDRVAVTPMSARYLAEQRGPHRPTRRLQRSHPL